MEWRCRTGSMSEGRKITMKSPIIENLEYRLSVLEDERKLLTNRFKKSLPFGAALNKKQIYRLSQISQEIKIIKQALHSQKTIRVTLNDTQRDDIYTDSRKPSEG